VRNFRTCQGVQATETRRVYPSIMPQKGLCGDLCPCSMLSLAQRSRYCRSSGRLGMGMGGMRRVGRIYLKFHHCPSSDQNDFA
jgi:hypothetical protein